MAKFSEHFGIGLTQPELDFVDIPLEEDLPVYLDPFAISLYEDDFSAGCNDAVVAFFQNTIAAIRAGDDAQAQRMLQRLSEPNETHLGVSSGAPQGRGVSGKQAFDLYKSIVSSKAAKSGLVSELSECDLFIDGVGPDKISDMATNIVRRHLIAYTQRQCDLHNVNLAAKVPSGFIWDESRRIWREEYAYLPVYAGQKLLLVPKNFVRRTPAMNSQDYLNKHILEYLQAEHLHAGSGLVEVFKNGKRKVHKRTLREHYPCNKDWMATFSAQHPEVLKNYKNVAKRIAERERKAEADFLNGDFDECLFAEALIQSLQQIPAGNSSATDFHNLTKGIVEFLFWPNLINPVKELEIHDGRKRIDIMYTNSANGGFFHRMLTAPQTVALKIPVECKNYTKDPANPELDQIAGRFAPNRGWLGFMIYRTVSNYDLLIKRCHDTAVEKRGFVIPLGDNETTEMLQDVASGKRGKIDDRLSAIVDRIIH